MRGTAQLARWIRRGTILLSAGVLPVTLTPGQAGALPIPGGGAAVVAVSPQRPVTLAQRRGSVRQKLAAAGGVARLAHEHPRTSRGRLTQVQRRQLQKVVTGHRFVAARGGQFAGSRTPALSGSTAPAASADPLATPGAMLATGPAGLINWDYLLSGESVLPGYPGNGSANFADAGLFPGETITATVAMYNNTTTNQQVHVTWITVCGGTTTNVDMGQVVTAPPASQAASVQGGVASFTFKVPTPGSATCASGGPGVQAMWFFANGTVTGSDSSVGEGFTDDDLAVPAAQFAGCPGSPNSAWQLNPQDICADPVDTASGEFSDTFTDATLHAPGYTLSITRSYSSAVTAAGPMGSGWSLPWQSSLSVQTNGDVILTTENGDQFDYTSNGDGTFTAPPGPRSVLAAVMSGSTITGYTLTAPDNHVLTFTAAGQLQSIKDSTGRGITLGYTGSQVTSLTDAAGHQVTLTYASGLLTTVHLPGGRGIGYGYTSGRLTSATTPGGTAGEKTTYAYSSAGLLASAQNPDGNFAFRNAYNAAGQVTSQEDGTGAVTTFSYTTTSGGLPETDVTHPGGGITTDVYGGGTLLESINPLGGTTAYEYNGFLEPTQVTDPLGNIMSLTYDTSGNPATQTDPLGNPEEWSYNGNNTLAVSTDPNIGFTTYTYNSKAEPTSVTVPGGGKATYGYNSAGSLTSATDPRGNVSGATAASFTTTYGYNGAGQLASVTSPDGNVTATTYDSMGYPLTITDPLGHVTTDAYNSAEELASVTAPDGGITRYAYDLAGNLTTRTDPDGHAWTYAYDADNRLSKVTDPLGNSVTYGYDGNGNQVTYTDARGIVTTTSYDADNRPVKITYSDSTPTVTYAYNADSNLTSVTDATGTRTLSYNADGSLISAAGPGSGSFSYTYAPDGTSVGSRTYPDGTTLTYGHNSAEQISSLTDGAAHTTYTYDPAGNLTSTVLPDGVTESRAYNGNGQLTGITDTHGSTTLDSYALTLNADGQPTKAAITQNGTAQAPLYYTYDAGGRLASACQTSAAPSTCTPGTGGNETTWTYDKAGNMLTKIFPGTSTSYTYNADEELTQATAGTTSTSYAYDAGGDLTTAGATTYGYNGAGELSKAVTTAGTSTYTHDATGDLSGDSKNGTLQQTAIWDLNNPLPQVAEQTSASGATTADLIYNPNATFNAMVTPAGTDNAITNWLGSVTGLVNSAGTQVSSTAYAFYGSATTTGTPVSPVGYAGSYALPGSGGLDDMNARNYNPANGTFVSVNSMLKSTGQPYAYASDSPMAETDPSGACPSWLPCGLISDLGIAAKAIGAFAQYWYASHQCGVPQAAAAATGNASKLSRQFGYSQKEILNAIERVKQDGMPRGGPVHNPNVVVDQDGEVYPLGPGGQPSEDSIGNILDYLIDSGGF
jgi:RHS repeat-associated protein